MGTLLKLVRECKELGVKSVITGSQIDKNAYKHKICMLMNNYSERVLDILDDVLTAQEEEKI